MLRGILTLTLLLMAAAPAWSDLIIRLKDGQTIRVQVNPEQIASIDFYATGNTSPRTRWNNSAAPTHYFEKRGAEWVECSDGKVNYRFVERSATSEYTELFDRSRNVTVRIFADRFTYSTDGKSWTTSGRGSWQ